jgi:uncharacterized membrane protein
MSWLRRVYLELTHNSLLTFVIVTLAAWLIERIANYFVDSLGLTSLPTMVNQFWNPQGIVGLIIGMIATVLAVLVVRLGFGLLRRLNAETTGSGTLPPTQRGLILVYGREATARKAIDHHRASLDMIWFILTEQTEAEFNRLPPRWWGRAVAVQEKVLNPLKPDETARRRGPCAGA